MMYVLMNRMLRWYVIQKRTISDLWNARRLYCLLVVRLWLFFFFSSRRRHTRLQGDWSSDVCSSDLDPLVAETHARAFACDAADAAQVSALFEAIDPPDLVVYNPSYRVRGPFLGLAREEVLKTLLVTAYGGFLVAQAALEPMVERGQGALFFSGALATVKGYAEPAAF